MSYLLGEFQFRLNTGTGLERLHSACLAATKVGSVDESFDQFLAEELPALLRLAGH